MKINHIGLYVSDLEAAKDFFGAFTDDDGRAYLLVHHGEIYRLSEDFHSLDSCMAKGVKDIGESPAMMKKDGVYYWLSSHTTSWERNDNMYSTATSLSGPWTSCGNFCPEGAAITALVARLSASAKLAFYHS